MTEQPDTTPKNALERFFRRGGAKSNPPPAMLGRDALWCVLFAALGVVLGLNGDWWAWPGVALFVLGAVVLGAQWWRYRGV